MNKSLLLLIPLLAACAPTTASVAMPFAPGQTWVVSSHSALDPKLPSSTTFTVQSVQADSDGDWTIRTKGAVRGTFYPDQRSGASSFGEVLLYDAEPLAQGAQHLRVCMLPVRAGSPSYSGAATHTTLAALSRVQGTNDPEFRESLNYLRGQQGSADPAMLLSQGYTRYLDASDLSSCSLVRQN